MHSDRGFGLVILAMVGEATRLALTATSGERRGRRMQRISKQETLLAANAPGLQARPLVCDFHLRVWTLRRSRARQMHGIKVVLARFLS